MTVCDLGAAAKSWVAFMRSRIAAVEIIRQLILSLASSEGRNEESSITDILGDEVEATTLAIIFTASLYHAGIYL